MTRIGLKKLRCEVCGTEREVEVGIRTLYCCAQPMKEVVEEEPAPKVEEEPAPKIKRFEVKK